MYIPTDFRNLYKYRHFQFKTKGLRGYLLHKNARLQIMTQNTTFLNPSQFEAARRILSKLKKNTDANLIFKHVQTPFSKKPLQTRMGKGKGKPHDKWLLPVRKGMPIIFIYNWFSWQKFKSYFNRVKNKFHTKLKVKFKSNKSYEHPIVTNYKWFIREQ